MATLEESLKFYSTNYTEGNQWFLTRGDRKVFLGSKDKRCCRFCQTPLENQTFKKLAHAIPEAMGNNSLFTCYECDACNQHFGSGIENDFGIWSKPMRTLCRIKGKRGVPSIRLDHTGVSRIDVTSNHLNIRDFQVDPKCVIDENANKVEILLKRGSYTPVAVLKAFVKIGISLVPDNEMSNFETARQWIRTSDHEVPLISKFPLFYTFIDGPLPNDKIALMTFFRRPGIMEMPYAFYILAYGNEIFQIFIPSPEKDAAINGKSLKSFPVFPNPYNLQPNSPYKVATKNLNLTGRERTAGEEIKAVMGFERIETI